MLISIKNGIFLYDWKVKAISGNFSFLSFFFFFFRNQQADKKIILGVRGLELTKFSKPFFILYTSVPETLLLLGFFFFFWYCILILSYNDFKFFKNMSILRGILGLLKVVVFKYVCRYLQSAHIVITNHRRIQKVQKTILLLFFYP